MSNLQWLNAFDLLAKGQAQPGLMVQPLYKGPFPWVRDAERGDRGNVALVAANIFKVAVGSDEYVTVVLCNIINPANEPEWCIYCGDKQVSGAFTTDGKTLVEALKADPLSKVPKLVLDALDASPWVDKVPAMAACGFFKMLARSGRYCSHTQAALAALQLEDLQQMEQDLRGWLEGEVTEAVEEGTMEPEEAAFRDAAFIQHVLLAGERGAGKTFLARKVAEELDAVYLEMQMHPSMEAWEFRAHDRACDGRVFTVMGKLAEAVYWIQKGKRVVLCMDEFLNMNPIYQTVINTALTLTANDTYIIETGRIVDMGDGIGRIETVEVPADMLWVVATSNVGARYNLDKIAPSVRARFQIILMNTNAGRTKKILEKNLAKYDMPRELAEKFKVFIEAANQAVRENTLDEEATTRLACNVIRAVHKKAVRDKKRYSTLKQWLPRVKTQLMAEMAQVVNFELGGADEDQEALYTSLVESCFKA